MLHQAQGVVQAGARREVCSPDSHNARSLHCSQGTLFTTMHAPCVQQVGSGQSRLHRGSSHWGLGEPGDAGELVAIWLRSVLSVRALMGRRAGPQAHYAPGGAG